jgi:hypothetical protein
MAKNSRPQSGVDQTLALGLGWLADAPMFIDSDQVTALYNAVIKREYETEKVSLSLKRAKSFQLSAGGSAGAEIGLADWLTKIFPGLDAKAKVNVDGKATGASQEDKESTIELSPIDTPQRQLVQLSLHYFENLPDRIRGVSIPEKKNNWLDDEFVTALPRGLVFVDFPPETPFLPMATELSTGTVELIYLNFGPKGDMPKYPEAASFNDKPTELRGARRQYWKFFRDNFSSIVAMQAVEAKASSGETIRWIDYRVPIEDGKPWLHLSVSAYGRYHTGTFAYRWVQRGYNHGLRIVGTMKSGPAMNVLAVFER